MIITINITAVHSWLSWKNEGSRPIILHVTFLYILIDIMIYVH